MKHLCRTALLLAFASCAIICPASTITYNLSNVGTTFVDGNSSHGSLTGSISVDTATDRVTSADLTFNDPGMGDPTFTAISSSTAYNGLSQTYITALSSGPQNYGGQIALFFNTASVGTGDLSICTSASTCGSAGLEPSSVEMYSSRGNLTYDLTGGTLSSTQAAPVALTPEPSGLILLGTGILAFAGSMLFWPAKILGRTRPTHLSSPA